MCIQTLGGDDTNDDNESADDGFPHEGVWWQILQEDYFLKNFEGVYKQLCDDVIAGKRMTAIPLKFLTISTSKSEELLSGVNIRKKYSTFKTYINNTLTVLWKK